MVLAHRHHGHHHHRHGGQAALLRNILLLVVSASLLLYALLEKKMLPRSWWRPLSSFFFWPMALPNLLVRLSSGQPYFSELDGAVLLGAVPMVIAGHVKALHEQGVRAVVNLQAEYGGPVRAYAALDPPIEQLWLPVIDHTEPSVGQLEKAVAFIELHRMRGARVLVHCKGGHGRSAAVAMAWLMSESGGGLTPEEAQQQLSSVRRVRSRLYEQPDILEYYERHGGGG